MKSGIKLTLIAGVLLVILGVSLACTNTNAANGGPSSKAIKSVSQPGIFRVTNLAINPAEVNAGVQALITARVTNTGNTDDKYQSNIRIDDVTKSSLPTFLPSSEVTIEAGATQLLSVMATINYPGTYQVTWDNASQELVVNPEEATVTGSPQNATPNLAPDFTAVDIVTGKTVSLNQYRGTAILLNFVNYGCNATLNDIVSAQLKAIKTLVGQRHDFEPISVFCGCCPPEVLRQFAQENNLNWPWILDTDYSIATKYADYLGEYGYPALVFIDKNQFINEVTGYTALATLRVKLDKITSKSLN